MSRPWNDALWSLLNRARFAWRRATFRPRPGLRLPEEPWETLFPEGSELAREAERLRRRYRLDWPDEHLNQRENLHVVGLFEAALGSAAARLPASLSVLDIGAKDWHYLPGLYRYLAHAGRETPRAVTLTGFELDPYHRYADGYTRYDYAWTYAEGLDATYRVGDVRAHHEAYDLVLLLHPLWREAEWLDWGLPREAFDIEGLLRHARGLLRPGGSLLVTAYRSEQAWAEATLAGLGWEASARGAWRSPFVRAAASLYWRFE